MEIKGLVIHRSGLHLWDVYFQHISGTDNADYLSMLHLNFSPSLPTSEPENDKRAMLVVFSSRTIQASLLPERFRLDWNQLPIAIIGDLYWSDSDEETEPKVEMGQEPVLQTGTLGANSSDALGQAEQQVETRRERARRREETRRVLSSSMVVFKAAKSERSQNIYRKTHFVISYYSPRDSAADYVLTRQTRILN